MKNKNIAEIALEILILFLMIKPIFQLGLLTGIGFIIAIIGSVKDGSLFFKPNMTRFIFGGTILAYAGSKMLVIGLKSSEWISFGIISVMALSIWLRGYFLKKGIDLK